MNKRVKVTVQPTKGGNGWDVVSPAGTVHHETKAPAVTQGRQVAKAVPSLSQLVIKGENGRIQTEHTYGADPEKYRG